jgi:hypothetical protein
MAAATIPDVCVSSATIAARTAMTTDIPTAVHMKEILRPSFSMLHHVPNEATRNQTCKMPDKRRAVS